MKELNRFLNIIIGSFIGVFIGRSAYAYWFYRSCPDIYTYFSAPWYTDIILYGIMTGTAIIILLAIKFFVKRKLCRGMKATAGSGSHTDKK